MSVSHIDQIEQCLLENTVIIVNNLQIEDKYQDTSPQIAPLHDIDLALIKMGQGQRLRPRWGRTPTPAHTYVLPQQHWTASPVEFLPDSHQQQVDLVSLCPKWVKNHFTSVLRCAGLHIVTIIAYQESCGHSKTEQLCQVQLDSLDMPCWRHKIWLRYPADQVTLDPTCEPGPDLGDSSPDYWPLVKFFPHKGSVETQDEILNWLTMLTCSQNIFFTKKKEKEKQSTV